MLQNKKLKLAFQLSMRKVVFGFGILLLVLGFSFADQTQPKPVKKAVATTAVTTLDAAVKSVQASIQASKFTQASNDLRKYLMLYPANAELLKLKRQLVLADYKANVVSQSAIELLMERNKNINKCDAGKVSATSDKQFLQRLNYVRRLAGLYDSCVLDPALNKKAQYAAYMMDVNNQLSHSPASSWKCYTKEGAATAGLSNLSLGYGFIDALMGQIEDDGLGNDAVGHRRWIFNSENNVFGHGSTDNAMCLYVISTYNKTLSKTINIHDTQFVAWPSVDYFPLQMVPERWSFSLKGAEFAQATVTVNAAGKPLKVVKEKPADGYAMNTLVWKVPGVASVNVTYTVRIKNVKVYNTELGKYQMKSFNYTVTPVSED